MSDQQLRAAIAAYLNEHTVLALATAGPGGPWASPVFYAQDGDLNLYFFSSPASRHGKNLAAAPRAAGAVTDDGQPWQSIRGVQAEGLVVRLAGRARARALDLYLQKFPFAADFLRPGGAMYPRAGRRVALYRLQPDRLCLTDNRRGFGHRECLEMAVPARP